MHLVLIRKTEKAPITGKMMAARAAHQTGARVGREALAVLPLTVAADLASGDLAVLNKAISPAAKT
jgi:hypothetical protein